MKFLIILILRLLAFVGIFLAPIQAVLISIFLIISFDIFTSVCVRYVTGKAAEPGALKKSIIKTVVYQLLIVVSYVTEQ